MPVTDQIRDKPSQLPHKPGVYLMKDRFGRVIYVEKPSPGSSPGFVRGFDRPCQFSILSGEVAG